MSQSLRNLRAAVREFASRPIEEHVDPIELSEVLQELEVEMEVLDESPNERAARDEALALAIKRITESYCSRH
jgi:hypothetical protein